MRRPSPVPLAVGLLVVLTVTACSGPRSVADRTYRGVPDPAAITLDANGMPDAPTVVWLEKGESFALTSWGSSSCAPVPTSIETSGDGAVAVALDASGSDACTDDMAPTTYELSLPTPTPGPLRVEVAYEGWDDVQTLTLD